MPGKKEIFVVLGLDVEEEGLFSGRYQCKNVPVKNVACLGRLEPFWERGIRTTLFCAQGVFQDACSRGILETMLKRDGVEIGAHLHHWNTPPLLQPECRVLENVAAKDVPQAFMRAKLETLVNAASAFLGAPVKSFRMGRWDFHSCLWPHLFELGIKVDASVRPLHYFIGGPDHFDAPPDPYWLREGRKSILEVPLTVEAVSRSLCEVMRRMPGPLRQRALGLVRKSCALALLPVEHPLWLLKLTTLLHTGRGGRVISLTWHSSEMMAGGAPHMSDDRKVSRFLNKMRYYFDWLGNSFRTRFLTMSELASPEFASVFPVRTGRPASGDWSNNGR